MQMKRKKQTNSIYKWLFILVLGILIGLPIGRYSVSQQKNNTKIETIYEENLIFPNVAIFCSSFPIQ